MSERSTGIVPERLLRDRDLVVHVYPFGVTTPSVLLREIRSWTEEPGRLPFITVLMGQKANESSVASDMLTPLGGSSNDPDLLRAAVNLVTRDGRLDAVPHVRGGTGRWLETGVESSFCYSVSGRDGRARRAYLMPLPVTLGFGTIYLFPEEEKVARIVPLTVAQFTETIENGKLTLENDELLTVIGASSLVPGDPHYKPGGREQKQRQKDALRNLVKHIGEFEQTVRDDFSKALVKQLALMAFRLGNGNAGPQKRVLTELLKKSQSEKWSLETLLHEIHKIAGQLADFDFKALVSAAYNRVTFIHNARPFIQNERPLLDRFAHETSTAPRGRSLGLFVQALTRLFGRPSSDTGDLKLISQRLQYLLQHGNLGREILHALPFLAAQPDIIQTRTTQALQDASTLMVQTLVRALDFTAGQLPDLDWLKRIHHVRGKLTSINSYLQDESVTDAVRKKLLNALESHIVKVLIEVTGFDGKYIQDCWKRAQSVTPRIIERIRNADPKLFELYQAYQIRNELAGAGIARTILLSLGIDDKENGGNWPVIRFEADRQLLTFLMLLYDYRFVREQEEQKDHPAIISLNRFFGPVSGTRSERLEHPSGVTLTKEFAMRMRDDTSVLIELRPGPKETASLLTKFMQKPPQEALDTHAGNVIMDDIDGLSVEERIERIKEIKAQFYRYLMEQYPLDQGWFVDIIEEEDNLGAWDEFVKGQELVGGIPNNEGLSKAGSKGRSIIRTKINYGFYRLRVINTPSLTGNEPIVISDRSHDNAKFEWILDEDGTRRWLRTGDGVYYELEKRYNFECSFYPGWEAVGTKYRQADGTEAIIEPGQVMFAKEKIADGPAYDLRRVLGALRMHLQETPDELELRSTLEQLEPREPHGSSARQLEAEALKKKLEDLRLLREVIGLSSFLEAWFPPHLYQFESSLVRGRSIQVPTVGPDH